MSFIELPCPNYRRHKLCSAPVAFYFLVGAYLIVTANFDLTGRLNWHDQQRIAQSVFFIFLFVLWFSVRTRDAHYKSSSTVSISLNYAIRGFVCFAILGAVSALTAQYPRWALVEWSLTLILSLSIFFIAHLRIYAGKRFDHVLLGLLTGACFTYLVGFIAAYGATLSGSSLRVWDLFHGFSNVRFFGQFQTMTLPLLALPIYYSKSLSQKFAAFSMLGSWWMLAFASGTRGTWLGIFGAVVLIIFARWASSKVWLRWQTAGAIFGLALYGLLFHAIPSWTGSEAELINRLPEIVHLTGREIIWIQAWEVIKQHPILGIGPMHFATTLNGIGAHPHNSVLQFAAEWGIPAMLIIMSLAMYGLFKFATLIQRHDADRLPLLHVALLASFIAAAIQSLVDGVIVMPFSQTLIVLLIGWGLGIYLSEPADIQFRSLSSETVTFVGISTALLFFVLIISVFPELSKLQTREDAYIQQYGSYLLPRFWRQGWILNPT
jgi:putative inorganic carbon (HCO3(-)) transporter